MLQFIPVSFGIQVSLAMATQTIVRANLHWSE